MVTSEFATLLRSAQADLRAIQHMPDAYAFDEQVFGFHAQQACEKALKAWLLHLGCSPRMCMTCVRYCNCQKNAAWC